MEEKDRSKEELSRELAKLRKYLSDIQIFEARRKEYEKALQERDERYRSLVDSTDDSIYLVDRNFKYLFMNKKHMSRMEIPGEEVSGMSYSALHSQEETELFIERANNVIKSGKSIQYEYTSIRDARYFLQTFSPVKGSTGETVAVTVISKDITERKQMEEELMAMSLTDELTGLYNRRGFLTLADQHLKMANREKKGSYMLYADLDGLKEINDMFGHKEGDMVLNETAKILQDSYRDSDIIARIGGDEFVVIPIGIVGNDTNIITDRLKKKVDAYNSSKDRGYKLKISAGLAYYDPSNPCSVNDLLEKADNMMYAHKRRKKNV